MSLYRLKKSIYYHVIFLFIFSLRCDFVDIPDEDLAEKLKFYPEQIEQALISLTASHGSTVSHRIMEDIEADLR